MGSPEQPGCFSKLPVKSVSIGGILEEHTLLRHEGSTSPDIFTEIDEPEPSTSRAMGCPNPVSSKGLAVEDNSVLSSRLKKSIAQMEAAGEKDYLYYMRVKKDKLNHQVNIRGRTRAISNVLEGVSVFVNGHTVPTALEIRELIQQHGGEYHCYYEHGTTTYVIASSIATAKVAKLRGGEIFIRPEWLTDSIAAGVHLPHTGYLLLNNNVVNNRPHLDFQSNRLNHQNSIQQTSTSDTSRALDARDPNFIQQYYSRSRLHLISTLAQDMKDLVQRMRGNREHVFTGRELLKKSHASSSFNACDETVVFHVDMDCFFVSVAVRDKPDLKDQPIAITHSTARISLTRIIFLTKTTLIDLGTSVNGPNGVWKVFAQNSSGGEGSSGSSRGFAEIASCSYAARAAGLKNGMLVRAPLGSIWVHKMIRDALQKCPSLICLPYQFEEYSAISNVIYNIVASYTLEIRAVSCDEMYVDVSKLCREVSISPKELAEQWRKEIFAATGCTASVGIGNNTVIARLSTRHAKPNGVKIVKTEEVPTFMRNEKLENLPGLGQSMISRLQERIGDLETCGDLQRYSAKELGEILGTKVGQTVYDMCRGFDTTMKDFLASSMRKSVSCDINYGIRFTKKEELDNFLRRVGDELERRLSAAHMKTASITLKIMVRSADAPEETAKYLGHGRCDSFSKSHLMKKPVGSSMEISEIAIGLMKQLAPRTEDLRGIGVQCGRLSLIGAPSITSASMPTDFFKLRRPRSKPLNTGGQPSVSDVAQVEAMKTSDADSMNSLLLSKKRKLKSTEQKEILDDPLTMDGLSDEREIERRIKEWILEDSSEDRIKALMGYWQRLAQRTALTTLMKQARIIFRFIDRQTSDSGLGSGWFEAVIYMTHKLDMDLEATYGAPMLVPALGLRKYFV